MSEGHVMHEGQLLLWPEKIEDTDEPQPFRMFLHKMDMDGF